MVSDLRLNKLFACLVVLTTRTQEFELCNRISSLKLKARGTVFACSCGAQAESYVQKRGRKSCDTVQLTCQACLPFYRNCLNQPFPCWVHFSHTLETGHKFNYRPSTNRDWARKLRKSLNLESVGLGENLKVCPNSCYTVMTHRGNSPYSCTCYQG